MTTLLTKADKPAVATDEFLLRAADYINEHGWIQNRLNGFDGSVCALGALYKVEEQLKDEGLRYHQIHPAFIGALNKLENTVHGTIPKWNDAPTRTKKQVIHAFYDAAGVPEASIAKPWYKRIFSRKK